VIYFMVVLELAFATMGSPIVVALDGPLTAGSSYFYRDSIFDFRFSSAGKDGIARQPISTSILSERSPC
jgi:hypothetical protein